MIPLFILTVGDYSDREFMIELYNHYYKAMYDRAYEILKEKETAEDAVQEALIKLLNRVKMLQTIPRAELLPYVIAVTRSAALDLYRKRKRSEENAAIGFEDDFRENFENDAVTAKNPFYNMEQIEVLVQQLGKLTESERTMLIDAYILELPAEEIAQKLGIRPASVRMYLSRARKKAFAVFDKEVFHAN